MPGWARIESLLHLIDLRYPAQATGGWVKWTLPTSRASTSKPTCRPSQTSKALAKIISRQQTPSRTSNFQRGRSKTRLAHLHRARNTKNSNTGSRLYNLLKR